MYGLIIWSGTENFVVLFCDSVPPFRPLFDRFGGNSSLLSSIYLSFGLTRATDDRLLIRERDKSLRVVDGSKKSSISLADILCAWAHSLRSLGRDDHD
jgi:hypothetical protein